MADSQHASAVVRCPSCEKQFRAAAKLFGTTQPCPGCRAEISIPMSLAEGPADVPHHPPGSELFFPCCICETEIRTPLDRAGSKLECPTCSAPNTAPQPSKSNTRASDAADDDRQYEVWPVQEQPTAAQLLASQPRYVALDCSLCDTRLTARGDQIGQNIRCPDCGAHTLVTAPREERRSGPRAEDLHSEYALEPASARSGSPTAPVAPEELPGERPRLPDWPLVQGVIGFPFRLAPLMRVLLLSFWLVVLVAISVSAMTYILSSNIGAFTGVLLLAVALIGGLIWTTAASACWVAILTESSDGNHRVEQWPDLMFLDWMFDGFYVAMAGVVSAIPGWALATLIGELQSVWLWVAIGASMLVWFPLILLSMLELSSPLGLLSPKILLSLGRALLSWLVFYTQSVLVIGGLVVAIWAGARYSAYLVLITGPLAVAVSFWYFRLLGRLGWCIAEALPSE